MRALRNLALCLTLLMAASHGNAQVFIPDPIERDLLNGLIPGIVDVGGMMDTLHPGIAALDSAVFTLSTMPSEVNFHGTPYLDALTWIAFATSWQAPAATQPSTITIEGLPSSLRELHLNLRNDAGLALHLPHMPAQMDKFTMNNIAPAPSPCTIAGFPEQLERMELWGVDNIFWSGTGHVNYTYLSWAIGSYEVHLPSFSTNSLNIQGCSVALLDLSQVETLRMDLSFCSDGGDIRWPSAMEQLHLDMCYQQGIWGPFPSTLRQIYMDMTSVHCMPWLPDGLDMLSCYPFFGIGCFNNWPSSLAHAFHLLGPDEEYVTQATANYCSVLNSTCPGPNPGIAGRVFRDLDNNGQYDAGEPGLPQASVTLQPNGNMVSCQPDGTWEIGVLPGVYSITAASNYPYIQSIAPATHSADVSVMGSADTDNVFAVVLMPDVQDLRVHASAAPARPGFDNHVYLRCENYGTTPVDAELTFTFDADQTWLGSSIAPSAMTGNTATWNFPAMPIGAVRNIVVELNTAASVPLGTAIAHALTADPIATDETPLDNTCTFTDSVIGSYDPNDKLLSPAVLTPDEVAAGDKPITYTIRFQNTGTYHAERVVILDTLSTDLQWSSMRFIASSHDQYWYITDGVLHVIHNDIMLPDSTADEAGSHGFFTFSMLPKTTLGNGSTIANIAHIVFDFNEPIITPPAVFTVDIGAGIASAPGTSALRLLPNPAHDRIQVTADTALPYRILNALGQPMQQGIVVPGVWLDVQALPAGAYIMETTEAGARTSLRFLKK